MKLSITVFKPSGKYYTSHVVETETHIPIYDDKFNKFVLDNLPASMLGGYVVVSNADEECNEFYEALYRYEDLVSTKKTTI